ncbi:hypothetical protein IQ22_03815 [Pseudomonas duriflava]|uniref:Uncharacterized protein n=1 Tax=Pseudomonas duriflava TaxID=459528 RepID=A0A562Q2J7_9PSED|nr:tetratricopeptide repeat protein [Pseudomonas duriflava]TWI50893.1 hypothetical protein IQ22_03815 [Pseudomonas duriflava]
MTKTVWAALAATVVLTGCATPQRGSIPVVDASTAVSNQELARSNAPAPVGRTMTSNTGAYASVPQDSGVTVMVPGDNAAPIQTFPAAPASAPISTGPITIGPSMEGPAAPSSNSTYVPPASTPSAPTGIPSSNSGNGLAADEQLDGPILALLTTAQQQQSGGDLNGASSSLERAMRIAPREPQVLYRLAEVRLAQGDAAQAEQLARRGLTYAGGRPALQASLWSLIAQSRERQGDAAGAAAARQRAKVGT